MLKKLFRYDFKWLMKTMPYYYIAVLVTAVCALVTNKTYNAHPAVFGWLIVDRIFSNLFLAACFSAGITLIIRCFVRFKNNLFKDEAYLTHTLPVKRSALFASKVLSSLAVSVITLAVIAIGVIITISAVKNFRWFTDLIRTETVLLGAVLIEEILALLLCIFTGTVIGERCSRNKTLKGVLAAVGIYLAVALFVLSGIGVLYLISPDIGKLFTEDLRNADYESLWGILKQLAACCALMYAVADAVVYLIGNKLLGKGVNID